MEPSQYLRLVDESLSDGLTSVHLLRSSVMSLYEHASFDPNQKIQTPNMALLIAFRNAMANVNESLGPIETQTSIPNRLTMKTPISVNEITQDLTKSACYSNSTYSRYSNSTQGKDEKNLFFVASSSIQNSDETNIKI